MSTTPLSAFVGALQESWYGPRAWALLKPLAWLYGRVVALRRHAYRRGWLRSTRVGVPVLVVGNITVGGSGKTPLTLALIEKLQKRGLRVGVVSRGYGGKAARYPMPVDQDSSTAQSGDEPVLIARRTHAAVAVDPVRARGAAWLIRHAGVDCLLADDGLQHYALARDAEIAVTDARRGYGNGWLLPAGPLREPAARLEAVDLALVHGADNDFWMAPGDARTLDGNRVCPIVRFAGTRVHAVAGIGDPARFFDMLRTLGLDVEEHPMRDHHVYKSADIVFADDRPVLMTEKDAVKCGAFATSRHWYVPVSLTMSDACEQRIDALLARVLPSPDRQ